MNLEYMKVSLFEISKKKKKKSKYIYIFLDAPAYIMLFNANHVLKPKWPWIEK